MQSKEANKQDFLTSADKQHWFTGLETHHTDDSHTLDTIW